MKLYHFAIIFVLIALTLFVTADVKTNQLVVVNEDIEQLDESFQRAIDDGVQDLVEIGGMEQIKINKDESVNDFFVSMYAALNITDNPVKQQLLQSYVPVIAVTCEDGYYLYYSDDYVGNDGYTYISKRWTEKRPYYYEDEDFIYRFNLSDIVTLYDKNGLLDSTKEQVIFTINFKEIATSAEYADFRLSRPNSFLLNNDKFYLNRKEHIIKSIELAMEESVNHHNNIAKQLGISYLFSLPAIDESEWVRSLDEPCLIVLFQGYPMRDQIHTYNRMVIAGAKVSKSNVYYLEQKGWYYVYHREDCSELNNVGLFFLDNPYYSVYECVEQGAYACKICNDGKGVVAPDYSP